MSATQRRTRERQGTSIGSPPDWLDAACMPMIDAVNCISYASSIPSDASLGTLGIAYENREATANTQSPYLLLFLASKNKS